MSTKVLVKLQDNQSQPEVYDISAKADNVILDNNNTTLTSYINTNNTNILQINTNYANLIKTKVPDAITQYATQLKAVAVENNYYVLQLSNDDSSWVRDIYVPKISNQQIDALFGSN